MIRCNRPRPLSHDLRRQRVQLGAAVAQADHAGPAGRIGDLRDRERRRVHEEEAGGAVQRLTERGRVLDRDGQRAEHRDVLPGGQPQAQVGAVPVGRGGLQRPAGGQRRDHRVVGVQRGRVRPRAGPAGPRRRRPDRRPVRAVRAARRPGPSIPCRERIIQCRPKASLRPASMTDTDAMAEHFDVLIIGAGLSGIGAAWRLQERLPGKTYAILEARDAIGGTWDLFRYPGRALGLGHVHPQLPVPAVARAPSRSRPATSIRRYIEETAAEAGITRHIRFGTKVIAADWSSAAARWTADASRPAASTDLHFPVRVRRLLRLRPRLPARFPGPGRLRRAVGAPAVLAGRTSTTPASKVVVIGSGATAVTLVPGHGRRRRARDHAAALPQLPDRAAGARRGRRRAAPGPAGRGWPTGWPGPRTSCSPRASTSSPGGGPERVQKLLRDARGARARRRRVRGRALHPELRAVGPAALRDPGGRPLHRDPGRPGLGGHRPHRPLRAGGHPADAPAGCSRPTSWSRPPGCR